MLYESFSTGIMVYFPWQVFSDKFKTIQKEQLDKFKEEQKESLKTRGDRAKELSKETNRRRKWANTELLLTVHVIIIIIVIRLLARWASRHPWMATDIRKSVYFLLIALYKWFIILSSPYSTFWTLTIQILCKSWIISKIFNLTQTFMWYSVTHKNYVKL